MSEEQSQQTNTQQNSGSVSHDSQEKPQSYGTVTSQRGISQSNDK